MNCSITLRFNKLDQNKNPYQIVLDGISEDSIQDYLNDYSKLLALVKAQGKLEEFLDYSTITGTKGSIYTSKDMEGLKDTNNFFAPNITYDKLRKKYGWLPELTPDEKANMNILFVKELVINGVPAPYVFQTKDLNGNPIYVVQAKGLLDFSRFITKYKAVTDFNPEEQEIPKALNTLIKNIWEWQAYDRSFIQRFADYNTDKFQRNKVRTEVVTDSSMVIAKQLMLSYLRDPDKMYFYGTLGKNVDAELLNKNIHKIQLIKNAISSIRGFNNKIVTTNSTLANAVFSKLIYGDSKGARISIKDFKKLVKIVNPEKYAKYFPADMKNADYANAINTVLNELFYENDDGTTNFDTKSYQVNAIKNGYIYFQKSFDTLEDHYSKINIESLPSLAQEMGDYKGYKIYKYRDDNNQIKYTFIRGLLTPQTYDYRISSGQGNELSAVKEKIDNMLSPNSRIHSRIYNDLYSDQPNQGTSLQIKTYMGQLVSGQIIRVYDYRLPKKSMQGFKDAIRSKTIEEIERQLRQIDLLDWFKSKTGTTSIEQSPLLDDNEKVFLTIATLNSLEGATQNDVKNKLEELIDSYNNYRYYRVTNIQDNGMANLVLMSDTNTHMTGDSTYLSVHNELMNLASKVQDRFKIKTQVLSTEDIKQFIRNNTSYTKDAEVNLLASQRAFVVSDISGNPIILINSDNARQSDIAHEYMHIFMGIVRANPNLQEQYTQLLTDLVSTKEGQNQLQQYQGLSVYKGLAQIDLMEEVAANVMGKYLVNPEKYPDNETFQIFKSFLEKNTFHQDLSENIIDFSDSVNMYDENSKLKQYEIKKANKTNTERLLTNYIQRNMGKQIMEDCK